MEPLLSPRLCLRPFRSSDGPTVAEYRNDPTTAIYQSWELPYPTERAQQMVDELAAMPGPVDGDWYSLAITERETGTMVGDVVVHSEWNGRSAEVGYTLAPAYRGRGYATEATGCLVDWLFTEYGTQRLHAALHPENVASMMVLERLGFVYEGTARQAFWVGDDCTDDPKYGLLRSDWEAWKARPRHRPKHVELAEITFRNRSEVFALRTHRSQQRFVSPMAKSAADALIVDEDEGGGPVVPWYRAIVADGVIAGFVMVAEPTATNPDPYLWRLLIDRTQQRRGIGSATLELIIERYRSAGHSRLTVSFGEGRGSPRPLYLGHGFVPTGELEGDETVAALPLR